MPNTSIAGNSLNGNPPPTYQSNIHIPPPHHKHTQTQEKTELYWVFGQKTHSGRIFCSSYFLPFPFFFRFNGLPPHNFTKYTSKCVGSDALSSCEIREIIDKATERAFYISTPSLSELLPFFSSFQLNPFEKALSEPYLGNLLRLNPTCSLALWVCLQNLNGTSKPGMRGGLLFSWLDTSFDWSEPSPQLFLTYLLFSFLCNSI